jgi:hypothetical protein
LSLTYLCHLSPPVYIYYTCLTLSPWLNPINAGATKQTKLTAPHEQGKYNNSAVEGIGVPGYQRLEQLVGMISLPIFSPVNLIMTANQNKFPAHCTSPHPMASPPSPVGPCDSDIPALGTLLVGLIDLRLLIGVVVGHFNILIGGSTGRRSSVTGFRPVGLGRVSFIGVSALGLTLGRSIFLGRVCGGFVLRLVFLVRAICFSARDSYSARLDSGSSFQL